MSTLRADSAFHAQPTRIDIRNILFATDYSSVSELAVPYLMALARRYGSTVHLAHVYPPEGTYEIPMTISPGTPHNRDAAAEGMNDFLRSNDFSAIPHTVCLRAGDIWLALADIIEKEHIDLLVLGSHGRAGLTGLLLGSVAEEVIRRASCPVMTVAPHVASSTARGEFRHILYATDFSSASQPALHYALALAQESNAQVTMLHVIEEPSVDLNEEWPDADLAPGRQLHRAHYASARERLMQMLPSGADLWCRPELLVEAGPPADMILQTAEERQADLIVMGARPSRMPHVSAHATWHTVHRVISHAHCPVLTVRE